MQIHHIVPWAKVQEHAFENLILLCANCHSRVTNGEIDTLAVRAYKANLAVLSSRYGDLERRVIEVFAAQPESDLIEMPGGHDLHLWYLIRDGLLEPVTVAGVPTIELLGHPSRQHYRLTPVGREFVRRWVSAQALG